jgi:hypothetical protein
LRHFSNFLKLPKKNNRPIGEKLVTLLLWHTLAPAEKHQSNFPDGSAYFILFYPKPFGMPLLP